MKLPDKSVSIPVPSFDGSLSPRKTAHTSSCDFDAHYTRDWFVCWVCGTTRNMARMSAAAAVGYYQCTDHEWCMRQRERVNATKKSSLESIREGGRFIDGWISRAARRKLRRE